MIREAHSTSVADSAIQKLVPPNPNYSIVQLENGASSLRSEREGETFHPVTGPVTEPENLYVQQLRLPERLASHSGTFVVWDVGLGAAANPIAFLRAADHLSGTTLILSFDSTLAPLEFALAHARELGYLAEFQQPLESLRQEQQVRFNVKGLEVEWRLHLKDFPRFLASSEAQSLPPPDAILYDPFSPARNPSMWTEELFKKLSQRMDPARPCALASYSRSTFVRVSLLLAGLFVGVGQATGEKEETTVAANTTTLINAPLDRRWLARVRRSTSAEPLPQGIYRQARLSSANWEKLIGHPQFA